MGFSALLCWAWGEHLVKYSSDANQLTYLGRYYNWVNRHTTGNNQVDNICVVDFHEASPDDSLVRYRIACAIERICDFDPLVVALDIRFKGRRNAWEDDYLEDVILRNRNRLVITRYTS